MERLIKGKLYFDPNFWIFKTHFPGYPVVPGTMIVDGFVQEIEKNFGFSYLDIEILDFKFLRFISPGKYPFKIYSQDRDVICTLQDNKGTIISKGKVHLKNGTKK